MKHLYFMTVAHLIRVTKNGDTTAFEISFLYVPLKMCPQTLKGSFVDLLPCTAIRQYLLPFQVISYCILASIADITALLH